jgi:NgoMIV restriction enzyme
MAEAALSLQRQRFHQSICDGLLVLDTIKKKGGADKGKEVLCASNADADNAASVLIANAMAEQLGARQGPKLAGQTAGQKFEATVAQFLANCFQSLEPLRPGDWKVSHGDSDVSDFEQFEHMEVLRRRSLGDPIMQASLGNDYSITPDIVISRGRMSDETLNRYGALVDSSSATRATLRLSSGSSRIMHANISCKWTMRSDRAQNARSEALNLIRNRKGRVPHIVAVVAEPTPSRLSSIALGTGDLDCVYHFALYELQRGVELLGQSEASTLLQIMIEGKRLKDISDLPLDLAV